MVNVQIIYFRGTSRETFQFSLEVSWNDRLSIRQLQEFVFFSSGVGTVKGLVAQGLCFLEYAPQSRTIQPLMSSTLWLFPLVEGWKWPIVPFLSARGRRTRRFIEIMALVWNFDVGWRGKSELRKVMSETRWFGPLTFLKKERNLFFLFE